MGIWSADPDNVVELSPPNPDLLTRVWRERPSTRGSAEGDDPHTPRSSELGPRQLG